MPLRTQLLECDCVILEPKDDDGYDHAPIIGADLALVRPCANPMNYQIRPGPDNLGGSSARIS